MYLHCNATRIHNVGTVRATVPITKCTHVSAPCGLTSCTFTPKTSLHKHPWVSASLMKMYASTYTHKRCRDKDHGQIRNLFHLSYISFWVTTFPAGNDGLTYRCNWGRVNIATQNGKQYKQDLPALSLRVASVILFIILWSAMFTLLNTYQWKREGVGESAFGQPHIKIKYQPDSWHSSVVAPASHKLQAIVPLLSATCCTLFQETSR